MARISAAAALRLRLEHLLRKSDDDDDIPKPKKRRTDGSAYGEDGESSGKKRVRTERDGGDRRKSKKTRTYEGVAATAAAAIADAAAEWEGDEFDIHKAHAVYTTGEIFQSESKVTDSLQEQDCIVVEEKDPQVILKAIDEVLLSAAKSSLEGKGYSLKLPSRSSKILIYKDGLGFFYRSKGTVRYDFSKDTHKTVVLTCVLAVIAETIRQGISVTNRDLFYCYKDIFGRQAVSDAMIANVCCWFRCTKSSLRVVSESKGSVAGPLVFKMKDKKTRSCSDKEGDRIPCLLSEIESFEHHAKFILLLEKKSTFHHLLQKEFHVKNQCIMITGSGYPDIATRLFLKRLHNETKLGVYAFMDPDPYGIQILCVYAFGSLNMSYARMRLAVPSMKWIGLFPQDLLESGVSHTYFSLLTEREKKVLQNIVKYGKTLPPYWRYMIQTMKDTKASTEALYSVELSYMSDVFLPKLLKVYRTEPVSRSQQELFQSAMWGHNQSRSSRQEEW